MSFRYPATDRLVLSSVDLTIPLGASTGIVGASGSGKSTILSLILGLYQPQSGGREAEEEPPFLARAQRAGILVGEVPYSACHIPSLRGLIGYVPQKVTLLPGTIGENIAYGHPGPQAMLAGYVRWAASRAGIEPFIRSLPEEYETRVGDGGVGVSGGQRQMLGIARALARQPQLLVMDEPTSNLDGESAATVRTTIQALVRAGVTVVVATHSRELMESLDQLVVLDAGQVAEHGTWGNLHARHDSCLRRVLGSTADRPNHTPR